MKRSSVIMLLIATMLLTSCGLKPYQKEVFIEVKPNETAFVIPMETGTLKDQTKLNSVEYLENNKVISKRIYIPTQWYKTGRDFLWMNGDGEWIPTLSVILVDRTPVTREWNAVGGTSKNDQSISVESKESIGFSVCVTATVTIPDSSASKFLYFYKGKSLEDVMDMDIRGYVQVILTTEFGKRTLTQCQAERTEIFNIMKKEVTNHFKEYGIDVMNIGSSGQFVYSNEDIQLAINNKYSSEMKIESANNEVISAKKFAEAQQSIASQKNLDADINIKNAIAEGIRSGKIPVPSTVAGSNISIMDLYGLKNMSLNK